MSTVTAAPTGEIKYKIGNEKMVNVTEPASKKLRSLLERQGRAAHCSTTATTCKRAVSR